MNKKIIERKLEIIQELETFLSERKVKVLPDFNYPFSIVLLYSPGSSPVDFKKIADEEFHSQGGITTFIKEAFRVTLIKSGSSFDFSYDIHSYYMNYFLGVMLKQFQLKIDNDGLKYVHYYNKTYFYKGILLTSSCEDVFKLLKLDYSRFKKGFIDWEEVFEFICSSPYFDRNLFYNVGHDLIFSESFNKFIAKNVFGKIPQKGSLQNVIDFFSHLDLKNKIEELDRGARAKEDVKNKFDGRTIMKHLPHIPKSEIGRLFGFFKHSFSNLEDFENFINQNDVSTIINKFKEVNKI